MDDTANLKLPYIMAAQAQKHVTHNEAIRALDAIVQLMALDRDLTAPPASPNDGERYIVAAGSTGAWAGQDNNIAAYQDNAWAFYTAVEGWLAWVADEDKLLAWDGAAWTEVSSGGSVNPTPLVGVNATADTTNRLSVSSPASLFNHEGAGHQVKVNKNAVADTASFLFQTDFSGRAEIGLTGDDDFHFKVSPDGTSFFEAIIVDKDDGSVSFPKDAGFSSFLDIGEITVPADPATDMARLYAKDDSGTTKLAFRDSGGNETVLGSGGGGSGDVTAAVNFGTNNRVIRSDGTGKGVQASMMSIDDDGRIDPGTGTSLFLGQNAGASDDLTNNANVFIGSSAGQDTTTGFSNIAIGGGAFKDTTIAFNNLAIGALAMAGSPAADNMSGNAAIGASALRFVAGNNNVGIGLSAGQDLVDASNNTIIGYNTGRGIATGSGNTIIGSNVTGLSASLANNVIIATNSTIKAQFDSSGNLQLPSYGTGTLQTDASGNVTASSDERLKNISGAFERGLDEIIKIEPITFRWNRRSHLDRMNDYHGFSAQNVGQAIPEAIGEDAEGYMSVSDRPLIAALVNAVKTLAARVAKLEAEA